MNANAQKKDANLESIWINFTTLENHSNYTFQRHASETTKASMKLSDIFINPSHYHRQWDIYSNLL